MASIRPPRSGTYGPPQAPMAMEAPAAIQSATVKWSVVWVIICGDQHIPDSLADTKNEKKKSESFSLYNSVLQWIQPRHGVNCTLRLHFPCGPTHKR